VFLASKLSSSAQTRPQNAQSNFTLSLLYGTFLMECSEINFKSHSDKALLFLFIWTWYVIEKYLLMRSLISFIYIVYLEDLDVRSSMTSSLQNSPSSWVPGFLEVYIYLIYYITKSFMLCTPHQISFGWSNQEDWDGQDMWHVCGRREVHTGL
jgi:hypothetical protein